MSYIGVLSKVIFLKLFLDIVPSSSADITRAFLGRSCGGFNLFTSCVSFESKSTDLQRCGRVFFDILITSKGASALGMF